MTTDLYRKLNNFDYSEKNMPIIYNYIQHKKLPEDFSDYKKKRYKTMFKDFVIEGDDLIYKPLNLKVIRDEDIEHTLHDLYNDPNQGIGLGIQTFYDKVNSQYLNITRQEVDDFIKKQSVYQITKPELRPVNKPIVGKYPNNRWAIDLIDMTYYHGHNKQKKWILSGIDYFSKKIFATPLVNKNENSTLQGLEKCIHEQMEGTYPKILQTDNGGEFKNSVMMDWANEHNVKLINTTTYSPTANALIENSNNFIRKMIREGFIRYNTFNWVDYLQNYVNNRNDTKHSITKKKPNAIWQAGVETHSSDSEIEEVEDRLKAQAKRTLERVEVQEFKEGDHVRATMTSLYSEQRKIAKQGKGKLLPVKYSPEVYIVDKVIRPRKNKDFNRNQYQLRRTDNNEPVWTEYRVNERSETVHDKQLFFGSDLQLVEKTQTKILTQHQGVKLNKLGVDAFNDEELVEIEEQKKEKNEKTKQRRKETKAKAEQELKVNGPRRSSRLQKIELDFND